MNFFVPSLKNKQLPLITGCLLASVFVTQTSSALAVTLVTSRTDLGENDQLDWSSLGSVFIPPPDPSDFLASSFSATSSGGLEVNVELPPPEVSITPPFVFQTSSGGVETNFAEGDFILFSGFNPAFFPSPGNPGPLNITFEEPVSGAGTQLAVDDTDSFIGSISAFDSDGALLGSFSAPGTSSLELDNSALFLGILSDTPNIKQLVFSTSITNRAIGINRLSIVATSVPESTSILALSLLGLGLIGSRHQRKSFESDNLDED